jgi:hypothetical protein
MDCFAALVMTMDLIRVCSELLTAEPLAKIRAFRGFRLADSLPSKVMESLRSASFQPARGKSNEAGWKPALRIKIALGEFRVLHEAPLSK